MIMTKTLQDAMNKQITAELWSANLYLSMSFYMEKEGFTGMAQWLKKQWMEENAHAYEFAAFMVKRGGTPIINKIDLVPTEFGTPVEVFEQVYKHECHVSKLIDDLLDVAIAENDKASQDFLWGFVREQVEEESTASGILDMLKRSNSMYMADDKMGQRQ